MKTSSSKKSSSRTEVQSTIQKYLDLSELEKSSRGPVFVLNNTRRDLRADVLISIEKRNGNGSVVVTVPATFIPIDLTQQVSKAQLLDSTFFRGAIGKSLLKLVTPEYAQKILSTEEAGVESERVKSRLNRARLMVEAEILNGSKKGSLIRDEDDEDNYNENDDSAVSVMKRQGEANLSDKQKKLIAEAERSRSDQSDELSLRFKQLVNKALADKSAEPVIIADLRNHGRMTLREVKYAMKHFKNMMKVMRFLTSEKERAK